MNNNWKLEALKNDPKACKNYSYWRCYDCPANKTPCSREKTNCGWGGPCECMAEEIYKEAVK